MYYVDIHLSCQCHYICVNPQLNVMSVIINTYNKIWYEYHTIINKGTKISAYKHLI